MSTLAAAFNPNAAEAEGVSSDFFAVMRSKFASYAAYAATAITQISAEQQFLELAATWKAETKFSSSLEDIVMHPAHQSILAMGPQVLPWILRDLKREPAHWFFTLTVLSKENPVPHSARGDIRAMTKAWIDWANARGMKA